jgi:hypothetical protein
MEKHIYGTTFAMDIGPQVNVSLTDGSRWGLANEPDHQAEFSDSSFQWHHVEIWIRYDNPAGAGNGAMKLLIDGNACIDKTNVTFTKSGYPSYTRFSIPSNMTTTGSQAPNYYFVDEVEIWDGLPDDSSQETPPATDTGTDEEDPDTNAEASVGQFAENWEAGDKSKWDDSSSNLVVINSGEINDFSLQRTHVQGTTSTGSCDKGFGDNGVPGFQTLPSERVNDATAELDVKFSTDVFPANGSTKVFIIESWPDTSYPSTSGKDLQAIVEVVGSDAHAREFVVTIKREGLDFYTVYQSEPVTVMSNQTYKLKLRVKLDQPYSESNGVLQFWVDGILKIDSHNEDFILAERGSDLPRGLNMLMLTGYTGGTGSADNKVQYWDNVNLHYYFNNVLQSPGNLRVVSAPNE